MKFIGPRNGKRNLVSVEKSRLAWKTGVIACQDRQASGLSEQPGTAVCLDSRDGCLPR